MKIKINTHKQSPTNYVGNSNSFTEEEFAHLYNETLAQVKCIMAVVNQSAYNAMLQAYGQISSTPLFHHKTKVLFKHAMKAYEDYLSRLRHGNCHGQHFFETCDVTEEDIKQGKKKVTSSQNFEWWLDIGSCAYKRSEKELEMLRFQIYQVLTYKQVNDCRVQISYVCLASSILRYSVEMFERLMAEFTDMYHLNFKRVFADFSLQPVYEIWKKVAMSLCRLSFEEEVPNALAENINNAYRAFENAIMRDLNTAESANEAIIENSDLLSPQEYLEYIHNYHDAKEEYLASIS